jgi:uncharacterized MAPEG superfamily protein
MTIALWCLLVACFLPIVCTAIAKFGGRSAERFDNRAPREWLSRQHGWRARANAAQQNSWEALVIFAAGVLTAHIANAPLGTMNALAVTFVLARFAYIGCYLADSAALRSVVWLVGFAASVALFFAGA